MNIIYLLLFISFALVCLIVVFFIWTVKSGQYDDLDKPSFHLLADDDGIEKSNDEETDSK